MTTIAIYARTRRNAVGNAIAGPDCASLDAYDAELLGEYILPEDYTVTGNSVDYSGAGIMVHDDRGHGRMIALDAGNVPRLRYIDGLPGEWGITLTKITRY